VTLPRGYTRTNESGTVIVARDDVLAGIVAAVRDGGTLHGFASRVPTARALHGREPAYAITLPLVDLPVVVRHNRHGGALRALTGDLFLAPTRAPEELEISVALRARNVPTPWVVACAIYPAGLGMARSDVVTEEIPDSQDFGALLLATNPDSDDRRMCWNAVRRLLKRLASAGVRHHDLNVKNILLRRAHDDLFAAYVLDVDRVEMDLPRRDAYAGNRARLRRSVEKWRDTKGARITAAEIEALRRTVPSIP
jgi:tRNA A-37 threonylcarbamoyl transferase component Bud32